MLTKTPAFLAAEQAGHQLQWFVYANTDIARRCFLLRGSPVSQSATGYYDGSDYVGSGNTFGSEVGTVQTRALLMENPIINKIATSGTRGLQTALSASSVGYVSNRFDNLHKEDGKYFFSNIITGQNAETFLKQPYEIRVGFPGLAYADQLSLFRGIITDSPLNGPVFGLKADAITSTLYDVWKIPKSSLYTNPAQDNQALPLVLGDMTENSAIDEDGDGVTDKGPIPLVCIDTVNDVWAMACHGLLTTGNGQTIYLYDDDGLIDPGEYTYTASNDYESAGIDIAYVTFSTPPTGSVTGANKGAPDDSGAFITNPIACAKKALEIMGETTTFEITSYQEALSEADEQGYTCAGLMQADNTKAYWIGKLLSDFIGSWLLDENNKIVVQLDTGSANFLNTVGRLKDIKGHLKLLQTIDNLITSPVINYAVSYAQIDRRFKTNANAAYLQTYTDDTAEDDTAEPMFFDFVRNTATAQAIASRISTIYAPLNIYRDARTTDMSIINWEPGDYFMYSSDWEYSGDGSPLCAQVGRVLSITIDGKHEEIALDFYNTGSFMLGEPAYYDGTDYVGSGSTFGGERTCPYITPTPTPTPADFIFDGSEFFDGSEYFTGTK